MHLQSLELFGFKSFADKTVFNFHEGVTAIVGPNGCGKSNVLDAVKWALGEQSAKSLRGDEMADVIFNGADTRKPVGFAEVSLTFTDCAEEFGIDWHDVRVTRRIYRDGNSEYLLNKTACRLRDIQSLFADTGIARSAYSMMEQGKIDMILSSRPEDARAVFEEGAAVKKYKTQRREALRKREATDGNLQRIGDVIKEVKRQIGSLQRQAGKARRYQALHDDLRVLDTHYSRKQLEVLETDLAHCQAEIARLGESEDLARAKIEAEENELAEQRNDLEEIDARIAGSRSELQHLESEINAHRNRIQFNRQRAEELNELIERSRNDIAVAETKRERQGKEIQEANALIEKTSEALQSKETELNQLTGRLSDLRTERSEHESKLETLEKAASEIESRIADLEDEISGLKIRRETTEENRRGLDTAISNIETARTRIQDDTNAARAAAENLQNKLDRCRGAVQSSEETLRHHQQRVASKEKELAAIERGQAEKESRLEILRQLNEEGEGLGEGSQAVLKGLHPAVAGRIKPALAGALVANLDVDQNFIPAIEAALGRNLQAIVLNDAQLAPEIIAALKEKKLGQAALVIPQLGNGTTKERVKRAPEKSLGWAIDKVKAPEPIASLVAQLLHDVAIFQNLDDALAAKKKHSEIAAATVDANQGEQEILRAAKDDVAKRENEAIEQLNELRLTAATERQRYEHLISQRRPMSARDAELAEAIAARQAEIINFEKRLTTQAEESRTAESAIEKQTGQRADLEGALASLTEQRRERSATMNEAESNLRTIRNSLNDLRDSRSKEQVRQAELQLKIDNLTEGVSRRYQINLREFSQDQVAFEKTLRTQLKRNDKVEGGTPATPGSPEFAPPDVEQLISDLRTQLDNMGPVNLDAVHEYDELEERYKFLEAQNTDLTNSRRELLDVIAQINSTTRKLFSDTFAQVRINFREMFAELFGGGRADLSLLDDNDPLNCGIEITAKPPGKQLQSISLLSGGERSMVAVGLLFAIYMVRPSPFCILDEVDAAMDEGNINRFVRVLDRFVQQSQFIIITHNKRTIAKAGVLYGVTMEERGVSRLVGMKLTAAQQISADLSSNGGERNPIERHLALAMR